VGTALVAAGVLGALAVSPALFAEEIVIYGFEGTLQGWAIPDWARSSADYVGQECLVSQEHAQEGRSALALRTEFPGGRWTGAYIEREVEVADWTPFARLSVDVYLPAEAPAGLSGRIILTVGEDWQWTEMNRPMPLEPGAWTALSVDLAPGSLDWKFFPDGEFRRNVRKLGLRIESDKAPAYRGSVFVDNVRLAE